MIELRRYNPIDGISLKVEVIPSSTTHNNPTINHNEISMEENEIAIEIRYKNYLEDGTEQRSTFTLPFEDGISWKNIYEGSFRDDVNDELDDIQDFARPTVIDAIARAYVGMVENDSKNVGVCSRTMLVNVEIDEFDEDVQGLTFDLDEDSYNNSYNFGDGAVNNDNSNTVKEARALLGRCGVSFGKQSSSGGCCTICLADEVVGVEVAVLPCSHVFHGDCIVNLLVKGTDSHGSCPLCRSKLC